ncbi:MAG TPA: hypothetical protein VGJ06_16735 [Candidatus Acidoferrum sp.]|jgi:hypothetical protein
MKVFSRAVLIAFFALTALGQERPSRKPFTIVISTNVQTIEVASGVWIRVNLTNTSSRSLDTSANISDLTGTDPNFIFDVRDSDGNSVPKRVYEHPELATGRAILGRLIKPGASLTEDQDISRLYDMSHPGAYVIQVSRRASEFKKDGVVKSNKITVRIVP